MTDMSVITEPFAERPGAYTRHEFNRVCAHWWWAAAIPVAGCAAAGMAVDAVWYFVMLIIIFTLIPAVVAFVWIYYSLSPEAARLVTEHTVTVKKSGIIVTPSGEDAWWQPIYIPADDIVGVSFAAKAWTITLRNNKLRHLTIPRTAVANTSAATLDTLLDSFLPDQL